MDIEEIEIINRKIGSTEPRSKAGLPKGWIKACITLQQAHLEKIRDLAWLKRTKIGDILGEMISSSLESFENSPISKEKIVYLSSGWVKTTVLLPIKNFDKLKVIALVKRTTIRDLLYLLLEKKLSNIQIRSTVSSEIPPIG